MQPAEDAVRFAVIGKPVTDVGLRCGLTSILMLCVAAEIYAGARRNEPAAALACGMLITRLVVVFACGLLVALVAAGTVRLDPPPHADRTATASTAKQRLGIVRVVIIGAVVRS